MLKRIASILLLAASLNHAAVAQSYTDQRTTTTRIADLLAQLPARDATQLQRNMQEITALGENGFLNLIGELTTAGTGKNPLLEYAIGGYTAYVMKRPEEADRMMSIKAYGKALDLASGKQNKEFLISQLELVGNDEAVPYLQNYLTDPVLADPSARALVKINSAVSKAALLKALRNSTGPARLSLISALGLSRTREAVPQLNQLALSSDPELTKTTLSALAYLADPSSAALLGKAASEARYTYEKTNALSANLLFAQTLLKDGNLSLARQVAMAISTNATAETQEHARTAALKILAATSEENPTALFAKAIDDENPEYRAAAAKFALPYITPETTPIWTKKLGKVAPEVRVEILNMLGKSRSKSALPGVLKLTKSKDQALRFAAIKASSEIGGAQVLDNLYQVMRKGDSSTIFAIQDAISHMKGAGIPVKIAGYLPRSEPQVQVSLIHILAARGANAQLPSIYSVLHSDQSAVRIAAFGALKSMVNRNDVPQLFELLRKETEPASLQSVQNALVAAYAGNGNKAADVDQVLKELTAAAVEKSQWYYGILASLAGPEALNAVAKAYDSDVQNRKAALAALASWGNAGAAPILLTISRDPNHAADLDVALSGYLKLLRNSDYLPEQRLLKLREAMAVAQRNEQRLLILQDLNQLKGLGAMLFAGKYLEDPGLQERAAQTVMGIALADTSLRGNLVRDVLTNAMSKLKGGDSDYEKEAVRKYLAEMGPGEGFKPLFNGKDLTGWKGLVADPEKRAKMSAAEFANAQKKANAELADSWKVIDGSLQFMAHGNNLATVKKYGDFEMLVDWKIIDDKQGNGDAGIYLRGTPQVQIWDTSRVKDGAQVGSGGLYNNKVNESKPLKVADNKLGEWNNFRILMRGDRVTVYLNGELVTDNVILENFWNKDKPIYDEEQIELQAHGSPVAYRDIYIKEIPQVKPYQLSTSEKKAGFKVLFDGTNMHEWTGNTTDYVIENGNIAIRPKPGKGSGGNLFTKNEYSDFVFRFEFQLTPGANNGLGIRAPFEGDAAYEGMELQILDNDAPIYKDLHIYQYHGSIYGVAPAKRGFLKPVGEWNQEEVIAKGAKIKVILNGNTILDADITKAREVGTVDKQPHPGLKRDSGHIGFLGHGSPVQFRYIRIKDLSKKGTNSKL
jgi:HEAT repeat protein